MHSTTSGHKTGIRVSGTGPARAVLLSSLSHSIMSIRFTVESGSCVRDNGPGVRELVGSAAGALRRVCPTRRRMVLLCGVCRWDGAAGDEAARAGRLVAI